LIWPTRAAPASYPSAQTRLHALHLTRYIHKLSAGKSHTLVAMHPGRALWHIQSLQVTMH